MVKMSLETIIFIVTACFFILAQNAEAIKHGPTHKKSHLIAAFDAINISEIILNAKMPGGLSETEEEVIRRVLMHINQPSPVGLISQLDAQMANRVQGEGKTPYRSHINGPLDVIPLNTGHQSWKHERLVKSREVADSLIGEIPSDTLRPFAVGVPTPTPSLVPSHTPTSTPTQGVGWLYLNTYSVTDNCDGQVTYASGVPTNVCIRQFSDDTGEAVASMRYICTYDHATIYTYSDTNCSASALELAQDYNLGCAAAGGQSAAEDLYASSLMCSPEQQLQDLPQPFDDGSYIIKNGYDGDANECTVATISSFEATLQNSCMSIELDTDVDVDATGTDTATRTAWRPRSTDMLSSTGILSSALLSGGIADVSEVGQGDAAYVSRQEQSRRGHSRPGQSSSSQKETYYFTYVYPYIVVYLQAGCKGEYVVRPLQTQCSTAGVDQLYDYYFYYAAEQSGEGEDDLLQTGLSTQAFVWTNGVTAYPYTAVPSMSPNAPTSAPAKQQEQALEFSAQQTLEGISASQFQSLLSVNSECMSFTVAETLTGVQPEAVKVVKITSVSSTAPSFLFSSETPASSSTAAVNTLSSVATTTVALQPERRMLPASFTSFLQRWMGVILVHYPPYLRIGRRQERQEQQEQQDEQSRYLRAATLSSYQPLVSHVRSQGAAFTDNVVSAAVSDVTANSAAAADDDKRHDDAASVSTEAPPPASSSAAATVAESCIVKYTVTALVEATGYPNGKRAYAGLSADLEQAVNSSAFTFYLNYYAQVLNGSHALLHANATTLVVSNTYKVYDLDDDDDDDDDDDYYNDDFTGAPQETTGGLIAGGFVFILMCGCAVQQSRRNRMRRLMQEREANSRLEPLVTVEATPPAMTINPLGQLALADADEAHAAVSTTATPVPPRPSMQGEVPMVSVAARQSEIDMVLRSGTARGYDTATGGGAEGGGGTEGTSVLASAEALRMSALGPNPYPDAAVAPTSTTTAVDMTNRGHGISSCAGGGGGGGRSGGSQYQVAVATPAPEPDDPENYYAFYRALNDP